MEPKGTRLNPLHLGTLRGVSLWPQGVGGGGPKWGCTPPRPGPWGGAGPPAWPPVAGAWPPGAPLAPGPKPPVSLAFGRTPGPGASGVASGAGFGGGTTPPEAPAPRGPPEAPGLPLALAWPLRLAPGPGLCPYPGPGPGSCLASVPGSALPSVYPPLSTSRARGVGNRVTGIFALCMRAESLGFLVAGVLWVHGVLLLLDGAASLWP